MHLSCWWGIHFLAPTTGDDIIGPLPGYRTLACNTLAKLPALQGFLAHSRRTKGQILQSHVTLSCQRQATVRCCSPPTRQLWAFIHYTLVGLHYTLVGLHSLHIGGPSFTTHWWAFIHYTLVGLHSLHIGGPSFTPHWWAFIHSTLVGLHSLHIGEPSFTTHWCIFIHYTLVGLHSLHIGGPSFTTHWWVGLDSLRRCEP